MAHRIIFVSQEISPYLPATENAKFGRDLPQAMQSRKWEVRTFMPDFGDINERRNQLHEVIRLSGLNIVINDNDHPLVVKVASMQPSRIQVYFMDNDDYFQKLDSDVDAFGSNRADNDERMIFYGRTAMDTARKLLWETDVMQVQGWMSALVPLYLKSIFRAGPSFLNTHLIYTILPEAPVAKIDPAIFDKLVEDGVGEKYVAKFREMADDPNLIHKMAIEYADAVVFQNVEENPDLEQYCESMGKKVLHLQGEGSFVEEYSALYNELIENK